MSSRVEEIIYGELAKSGREMTALELSELPGVGSRTYASRVLAKLVASKKIYQRKHGRNVYYRTTAGVLIDEEFSTKGLREETVWEKVYEDKEFFSPVSEDRQSVV